MQQTKFIHENTKVSCFNCQLTETIYKHNSVYSIYVILRSALKFSWLNAEMSRNLCNWSPEQYLYQIYFLFNTAFMSFNLDLEI